MSVQDEGLVGRLVGGMIRRSVKSSFRSVRWRPPLAALRPPVLFFANHHGWFDGYLGYLVASELKIRTLDWMQEYDTFPPFRTVGARPYPSGDATKRAVTVRETIKLMKSEQRSLLLFPEGVLHEPPALHPFGRSLEFLARKVPDLQLVPLAFIYRQSIHQKPEAFISVGSPVNRVKALTEACEKALAAELILLQANLANPGALATLCEGRASVNERWSLQRFAK